MPDRRDLRSNLLLDRYFDEVFFGDPAGSDLNTDDPDLAATVQRVHALNFEPLIRPTFENRLWEDLMSRQPPRANSACNQPSPRPGSHLDSKIPKLSLPRVHIPTARRRWLVAQFATAVLLIVTLIGFYFVFVSDNRPALQPTATPEATPGGSMQDGYEPGRTGVALSAGPKGQLVELWRFQTQGPVNSVSPPLWMARLVGSDDGDLYALD